MFGSELSQQDNTDYLIEFSHFYKTTFSFTLLPPSPTIRHRRELLSSSLRTSTTHSTRSPPHARGTAAVYHTQADRRNAHEAAAAPEGVSKVLCPQSVWNSVWKPRCEYCALSPRWYRLTITTVLQALSPRQRYSEITFIADLRECGSATQPASVCQSPHYRT